MPHRILLGNLPRCNRHLPAMSPEPKEFQHKWSQPASGHNERMSSTLPFLCSIRGLTYQTGLDAIQLAANTAQNSITDEAVQEKLELDTYNVITKSVDARTVILTRKQLDLVFDVIRQSGPILVPPWNTLKRNTNA